MFIQINERLIRNGVWFGLLIVSSPLSAEVTCSADLAISVTQVGDGGTPATPQRLFGRTVTATGADEERAKVGLEGAVSLVGDQIRNLCRIEYENSVACVSAGFASNAVTMSRLDFSARRKLEAAIADDCAKRAGRCGEIVRGEPRCVVIAPPTPTPGAEAAAEGGKKKR